LHAAERACFFARFNAGIRMAINRAMMAITTSSSMRVKALRLDMVRLLGSQPPMI
jgi:hypothetical protein